MKGFLFIVVCFLMIFSFTNSESILETLAQENEREYNAQKSKPVKMPPRGTIFDFIIIGGGAAGCTLASRLSENPNWSVCLIEAGGRETIFHDIPLLATSLLQSESDWKYKTTKQKKACFGMRNNSCALSRGKVLGGSSSINFMFYTRGNRKDYDRWAAAGNPGWSYDDVLPYFLRSEGAHLKGLENSVYHNHTGPLSVEDVLYRTVIANAFVKGAQERGHKYTDYNGLTQLGVSFAQATTNQGHRGSSAKSFIDPIEKSRKNLRILTFSKATKILIDPKTLSAYGVEYVYNGTKYSIRARKEVILSAGAFHSPQLLMLSGVGPIENLQAVGIPTLHNLPVGKVLDDHIAFFGPVFTTNTTNSTLFADRITSDSYQKFKDGDPATIMSSTAAMEALAFIKTPNSKEPSGDPDIEIVVGATSLASDGGKSFKEGLNYKDDVYDIVFKSLEQREHFTLIVMLLHPKSKGSLWLEDKNPFTPPNIDPNFLSEDDDVENILEGIKEAIKITKSPAMQRINATIHSTKVPGCQHLMFGTDDYWRCAIRVMSYSMWHEVGTCRMGPKNDPLAVVSSDLKVRGIRKLRVVDLSVMPLEPAAHTNAAAIMIAEKGADLVKSEWEMSC